VTRAIIRTVVFVTIVVPRPCCDRPATRGEVGLSVQPRRWRRQILTPEFAAANHEPRVTVSGPLNRTAAPGANVRLVAAASDPDGNALTVKWWQYTDADTYPGIVSLTSPETLTTTFQVPTDATSGQTIHALIQVTDNGTPALTSFQRVIVTVSAR
jgi:cellulose-binding protein